MGVNTGGHVDPVIPNLWRGPTGPTVQNLVADRSGDALVVEAGETENRITNIRNRYIIMTNVSNFDLKGKGYEQAAGIGADRLKLASQYIKSRFNGFDIDKGMETLKRAQAATGTYTTRSSLVFDPDKKEIYIALEHNFQKVWKTSLENQPIETHRGFTSFKREPIPTGGIFTTDLAK